MEKNYISGNVFEQIKDFKHLNLTKASLALDAPCRTKFEASSHYTHAHTHTHTHIGMHKTCFVKKKIYVYCIYI